MQRTRMIQRTHTERYDSDRFFDLREQEILRQVLRRELRVHGGDRGLAEEIGISRGSLRKFVSGQSVPTASTNDRIREFALNRPELSIPLALVGLCVLVADLDAEDRPRARRDVAAALRVIYAAIGDGVPTWVQDEINCGETTAVKKSAKASATQAERVLRQIRLLLDEAGVGR